jgi:1,2-dihydroxy-3-keto-5-methylthiopentene dioxygenase
MPTIYDHTRREEIPADQTLSYLADAGVHYEFWPVDVVPEQLRHQSGLNEADKAAVLAAFQENLARISAERGYISHDVIVLNPDSTPNLEELLANFQKTHHHTEDEVRFIVDGEGIFTLTRNENTFSITVRAGDLISVPVGTEHYFTLTESRNVKAIRLFQTKDGWVAIYKEDPAVETR